MTSTLIDNIGLLVTADAELRDAALIVEDGIISWIGHTPLRRWRTDVRLAGATVVATTSSCGKPRPANNQADPATGQPVPHGERIDRIAGQRFAPSPAGSRCGPVPRARTG